MRTTCSVSGSTKINHRETQASIGKVEGLMARISRVYKRTQVLLVTIDVPNHMKGKEDELFEKEVGMIQ